MRVRLKPRAKRDLVELWRYRAALDTQAADRLWDLLEDRTRNLDSLTERGRRRPDIGTDIRVLYADSIMIVYRRRSRSVEVLRYIDGRRDIGAQTLG